jgi:hypothetical protein
MGVLNGECQCRVQMESAEENADGKGRWSADGVQMVLQ